MFSQHFASNYTIENINHIFNKELFDRPVTDEDIETFKRAYLEFISEPSGNIQTFQRNLKFKYDKPTLLKMYRMLVNSNTIVRMREFEQKITKKSTRSHSGVNVVTIFTSPVQFGDGSEDSIKKGGCPMNCHYCPFERDANGIPTQPRSYLSTEPGNMRATQNMHHPVGQIFDRLFTLEEIGHISPFPEDNGTKIELIVSGGTFNFYPQEYLEWFMTCAYFAANMYNEYRTTNKFSRDILTLAEEQRINETAPMRIIGLTIETRPDYLDTRDFDKKNPDKFSVLRFFRDIGVTRVQIGVQHTNDAILKFVNRQCYDRHTRHAIYFLKQNGFKVDIHLMLDLPSSSPEEDIKMLDKVLTDSDYEADQWKIYPTEVTPYTRILEWYNNGDYKPYAEQDNGSVLANVIIHAKEHMKPWIRINRVIRDIPTVSIEGGISCPDMRQHLEEKMRERGTRCVCIRCREVKLQKVNPDDVVLKTRKYIGSDGDEYFISFETRDERILMGYIRLRLNYSNNDVMPELHNTALIRELHVLGKHTELSKFANSAQHRGYGRRLVEAAERIAIDNDFTKIAIISGVGVREYYRKFGYELSSTYMMKNLTLDLKFSDVLMSMFIQNIYYILFAMIFIYFI